MKKYLISIFSILLLIPITVFSQGYLGGTFGQWDPDDDILDKGTTYSLIGGYRLNDNFAFEVSLHDFGKSEYKFDPSIYVEGDGIDVSVLGYMPISEKFELFVKIGYMSWDIGGGVEGIPVEVSVEGEDFNYGVGAAFNVSENFSVVAGYHQYNLEFEGEKDDVNTIYLGGKYYFGNRGQKVTATRPTIEPKRQSVTQYGPNLRAISEVDKSGCEFITTITRGAGGPGDPSSHLEMAMGRALNEAESSGADSYFIVDTSTTASGASVVLEALSCR